MFKRFVHHLLAETWCPSFRHLVFQHTLFFSIILEELCPTCVTMNHREYYPLHLEWLMLWFVELLLLVLCACV